MAMSRKKVGRPAAKWVHQLANLDGLKQEYLDYYDLSQMFNVTIRSVHAFCTKACAKGEYFKNENKVVRKRFSVQELKTVAKAYIKRSMLQ
jgi:hypothetical protein